MAMDVLSYAKSKKFTEDTVLGGGAIAGKNCTIASIEPVDGGQNVTFEWTLDDGSTRNTVMFVPDGEQGLPGAKGESGEKGDKGDTGEQGPKGDKGDPGEKGADGTMSFDDLTDEQKESLKGPQGDPGEKGEKGDKGDTGEQGPQGDPGEKGEKGDKGDPGEKGEKGDKGDPGEKGADGTMTFEDLTDEQKESLKGPQGDPGEKGEKGDKGDTGEQGPQGEKGEKGDKGDTGEQGPQGDPGEKGEKGDKGDPGEKGEKGDKGDTGEQGPQGEAGPQGEKGDKGDTGEQGPQGEPGIKTTTFTTPATAGKYRIASSTVKRSSMQTIFSLNARSATGNSSVIFVVGGMHIGSSIADMNVVILSGKKSVKQAISGIRLIYKNSSPFTENDDVYIEADQALTEETTYTVTALSDSSWDLCTTSIAGISDTSYSYNHFGIENNGLVVGNTSSGNTAGGGGAKDCVVISPSGVVSRISGGQYYIKMTGKDLSRFSSGTTYKFIDEGTIANYAATVEEGVFNLTLTNNHDDGTTSTHRLDGYKYYKVGRLVILTGMTDLYTDEIGNYITLGTGEHKITGFPFACEDAGKTSVYLTFDKYAQGPPFGSLTNVNTNFATKMYHDGFGVKFDATSYIGQYMFRLFAIYLATE